MKFQWTLKVILLMAFMALIPGEAHFAYGYGDDNDPLDNPPPAKKKKLQEEAEANLAPSFPFSLLPQDVRTHALALMPADDRKQFAVVNRLSRLDLAIYSQRESQKIIIHGLHDGIPLSQEDIRNQLARFVPVGQPQHSKIKKIIINDATLDLKNLKFVSRHFPELETLKFNEAKYSDFNEFSSFFYNLESPLISLKELYFQPSYSKNSYSKNLIHSILNAVNRGHLPRLTSLTLAAYETDFKSIPLNPNSPQFLQSRLLISQLLEQNTSD